MKSVPILIHCTAWLLLGLFASTLTGFVTFGMAHGIQHLLAIKDSPEIAGPTIHPSRLAGCKPAATASEQDSTCPGCKKHHDGSAVMLKYYHIFTADSYYESASHHFTKDVGLVIAPSNQNHQFAPEPLTPPPKHFVS